MDSFSMLCSFDFCQTVLFVASPLNECRAMPNFSAWGAQSLSSDRENKYATLDSAS
jgi:hypothetical protein